eukprot:712268-Lingulodinium_polyedra.AAC.1
MPRAGAEKAWLQRCRGSVAVAASRSEPASPAERPAPEHWAGSREKGGQEQRKRSADRKISLVTD